MSRMGGFDARELRKLRDELEKLQEPEEFMKDCAKELAARLLSMVVQRTPADTGTLRRAWTAGTSSEGYAILYRSIIPGMYMKLLLQIQRSMQAMWNMDIGHLIIKDGYQESL